MSKFNPSCCWSLGIFLENTHKHAICCQTGIINSTTNLKMLHSSNKHVSSLVLLLNHLVMMTLLMLHGVTAVSSSFLQFEYNP